MQIANSQLVQLCADSYDPAAKWDRLWEGDIWAAIKKIEDTTIIVFRGSVTIEDWFRDFCTLPQAVKPHPQLGLVHQGFDEGLDEFFEKAAPYLNPRTIVCGHSLGAARAWLFAGRLVIAGVVPQRIVVAGSPRPACGQFRDMMQPLEKFSFKNRIDPVTLVPAMIAPLFPFIEPADFTMLNETPMDFGIMADHNIHLYAQGVKRLEGG